MRGENEIMDVFSLVMAGTSPRARGKPILAPSAALAARNIPACAGKTIRMVGDLQQDEEHPRVRGENHTVIEQ